MLASNSIGTRRPLSVTVKPQTVSQRRSVSYVSLQRRGALVVRASSGVAHPGEESQGTFYNIAQPVFMSVPNVTLAKGGGGNFGSGSSLGATLERSKLEFVMPTPVVQGPKLDDGGSGGDIGKIIHNGGGGGGDDDDDDDYSYGDGDGDGDGEGNNEDSFFRLAIAESYNKFDIQAVFQEWMKAVSDLPLILRRAVEMGLLSSAQLVRFFSMDVRPSMARAVSRSLPPSWAREFVGRLMADPAFVQKLVIESSLSACAGLWYEYRARGSEKFKKEFDLVMINVLGMAAATSATVWLTAPSRSYGTVHKFPWQQMLDGLPNCVFDVSGPLRNYTKQVRAVGFFAKMAELAAVGAVTGSVTSLLSKAAVAIRRRSNPDFEPSVPVPGVGRASGGLAAFFALNANTRYQLLGGIDGFLFARSNYLWTYMGLSAIARVAGTALGEASRPWWQGLPEPSRAAAGEVDLLKQAREALAAGPLGAAAMQAAASAGRRMGKMGSRKVSKKVPKSVKAAMEAEAAAAAAAAAAAPAGAEAEAAGAPVVAVEAAASSAAAPVVEAAASSSAELAAPAAAEVAAAPSVSYAAAAPEQQQEVPSTSGQQLQVQQQRQGLESAYASPAAAASTASQLVEPAESAAAAASHLQHSTESASISIASPAAAAPSQLEASTSQPSYSAHTSDAAPATSYAAPAYASSAAVEPSPSAALPSSSSEGSAPYTADPSQLMSSYQQAYASIPTVELTATTAAPAAPAGYAGSAGRQ